VGGDRTPDGIARWRCPGDIARVVGHSFLLEMPGWGNVPCEVLEALLAVATWGYPM